MTILFFKFFNVVQNGKNFFYQWVKFFADFLENENFQFLIPAKP